MPGRVVRPYRARPSTGGGKRAIASIARFAIRGKDVFDAAKRRTG